MLPELIHSMRGGYKPRFLLSDLMSGLLVAIIALPLSIALGIQSGATLQAGIITSIVAGFCISALGGTRFQIGGPSASFLVILFGYFANPEIGVIGVQIATVMAGGILLVMGLCRAGAAVRYVPFPIAIGFTTGIGITMLLGQMKDFLGLTFSGSATSFVGKLSLLFTNLHTVNFWSLGIGLIALAIIIFLPKLNRKIPAAFIAVLLATILSLLIELLTKNGAAIATIGTLFGDVKASFNLLDFSALGTIKLYKLIAPAFVLAFLSGIEGLLSATVADGLADTRHNSNQELLGQGVANIASALLGGLPATGAIARTAANIDAGAKSPLSGVFHALFLLLMYVLLMPVVKFIPMTALAAVLIAVSYRMSKFALFFRLTALTIRDTFILLTAMLLTVFLDLTYGVVGGFVLAILINIGSMMHKLKIDKISIDKLSGAQKFRSDVSRKALKLQGAVYFLNAERLLKQIRAAFMDCDELILDMTSVKSIDMTSVERLSKTAKFFAKADKRLVLHNADAKVSARYRKAFFHIIKKW